MSRTYYVNANLLDGVNPARLNATVAVEGQRIVAVSDNKMQPASGDKVVDLGGRTLMPGMVTGHFHPTFHDIGLARGLPGVERPPAYTAYLALVAAQKALRAGFTGVVGAGGAYDIEPSLAAAIRDGLVVGPRVVPCNKDLQSTADGVYWMPWWLGRDARDTAGARFVDGPQAVRSQVREDINRGAEMIKVYVTGGHGIPVPKSVDIMSRDELEMAVQTAHERGARVRVHISRKDRILHAIHCGVDVLDHADEIDDECIDAIIKAGTFVLPSLLYSSKMMKAQLENLGASGEMFSAEDHADFKHMCSMIPRMVKAGVRLCVGDDFGSVVLPHGEYGKELAVYVEHAGVSALEVIRWATRNGGLLMGREDLGTIAAGMLADLVIVDGDPSKNIHILGDLERIVSVIKDGQLVAGSYPAITAPRGLAAVG
jgi:imidazolonepropionase-like amidohydrolase